MSKKVIFKIEAQSKLKKGVDAVAEAVGATMGPLGRNVAISKSWGGPNVTHDGVTVAKEIELKDPFENMGAKLLLEAATKTNDKAGDGTTTATILAQALITEGLKNVTAGANPMLIRKGLEKGRELLIKEISDMAKEIKTSEERSQVATNSAQDEEIGKIISQAMDKVGADGVITVEDGKGLKDELTIKEGMNFNSGYLSAYFVTDTEKMTAEINDAYILITDKKISNIQEIVPLLESLVKVTQTLVIIAEDVEGQALTTLVVNKLRGTLKVLAIKAPGFGDNRKEMLKDIAAITGGTVISEEIGKKLDNTALEDLGKASRIISTKDDTTIVGGAGKKKDIDNRVSLIRSQMDNTTSNYDKEKLQERLAKLQGGVAIISVGGATEAEMKERKYRVEDAVNATQAAIDEGVVPGGGIALLKARENLKDLKLSQEESVAVSILYNALEQPFRKILSNAGLEPGKIIGDIEKTLDKNIGYDVLSGKHVNMIEAGIIDPAKVTKNAVMNAISVTINVITTEALVADDPDEKDNHTDAMPTGGGIPGMGF